MPATRAFKILIVDLVGLRFDKKGNPDHSEVAAHVKAKGGQFHIGPIKAKNRYEPGLHFFYQPDLVTQADILAQAGHGAYDAVIAAAKNLPKDAIFLMGGVRIGAGTGNMQCTCWGGGSGVGGPAPLMNTPSFNSRATAQMAMKALLRVSPDLPIDTLHKRSVSGRFDTGRHLQDFPTQKLEGQTIAIIGYGNIGREVAKLAQAFGMHVRIFARAKHKLWILSEGFEFAATKEEAADGADVLSVHTGLGAVDATTKRFANVGIVGASVLKHLNQGAVLLNYDRGECVDAKALDATLRSGRVRHAAIDADVFLHKGKITGPLAPFVALAKKYGVRVSLLPHAAADTDHVSRVEGAKQAVDQIWDAILYKRVTNLKGALPVGYVNAGSKTVLGVGKVSASMLQSVLDDRGQKKELLALTDQLSAALQSPRTDGKAIMLSINRLRTAFRVLGLEGPYGEDD
jgi:lactate dehydrogenase-like 2-hydroxyacid dehydrogenase